MASMKPLLAIRRRRAASPVPRFATLCLVTLAGLVPVLVAAACSPSSAGTSLSVDPAAADVTLVSRNLAFDRETITIPAGSAWSLQLVNTDAAPHNVAIYTDETAGESLFVGELISSTTVVYQVPALEPGTYFFRCDLHPEMNGNLELQAKSGRAGTRF